MNRKITRYRDDRAHRLVQQANAVLAAASMFTIGGLFALWGSQWALSPFHWTMMSIAAGLASLALSMLEAARRIEKRKGYHRAVVRPASPAPEPWTGNRPRLGQAPAAAEATFVPPDLPAPTYSDVVPPVPAPTIPVPYPVAPVPVAVPVVPAVQPAPVQVPAPSTPVRSEPVGDDARELAGQS